MLKTDKMSRFKVHLERSFEDQQLLSSVSM